MRKALFAIFAAIVLFSGYHLSGMSVLMSASESAHLQDGGMGPDCPMGFVCPVRLGSIDFTAVRPSAGSILPMLVASAGAVLYLALRAFRTGYAPPVSVTYNSGPPVIRSTVKRE